jgi:hypothetical protein
MLSWLKERLGPSPPPHAGFAAGAALQLTHYPSGRPLPHVVYPERLDSGRYAFRLAGSAEREYVHVTDDARLVLGGRRGPVRAHQLERTVLSDTEDLRCRGTPAPGLVHTCCPPPVVGVYSGGCRRRLRDCTRSCWNGAPESGRVPWMVPRLP